MLSTVLTPVFTPVWQLTTGSILLMAGLPRVPIRENFSQLTDTLNVSSFPPVRPGGFSNINLFLFSLDFLSSWNVRVKFVWIKWKILSLQVRDWKYIDRIAMLFLPCVADWRILQSFYLQSKQDSQPRWSYCRGIYCSVWRERSRIWLFLSETWRRRL